MNLIEAIILGIIQGLTEFIPISSTAHLTIAGKLLGIVDPNNPEQWTAFIAVVQLGTLLAVLIYFYRDLAVIPGAFINDNIRNKKPFSDQSFNSKMAYYIVIGSIPIVIIGLIFKKVLEGEITKDPIIIGISLIVLGIILAIAEKTANMNRSEEKLSIKDSIIVGLAQCLALIPGSSRSGTTITAGLFLGLKRDVAARFSFLLSIPAVLGSGLLEFYQSLNYLTADMALNLFVATFFSAISGYAAIAFLISYLKKRSTMIFVYYRIVVGILVIFMALKGFL